MIARFCAAGADAILAAPMATYLDNAATTRMLPEVADEMREIQVAHFGNPSSTHDFGDEPRRLLAAARRSMADAFAADRVVFTSGGSEADLLGIAGAALARGPGRVLVGRADHPAVLAQRDLLERLGYEFVEYEVDASGAPSPASVEAHLGPEVRAVALLHGHNELGTLAPLDELVPLVRDRAPDAHVHVDAVQVFGKTPFDLATSGVDSAAISAHKFHGPRGVGCLALARGARVTPIQPAGGQEHALRGGTENVAGIVAMARAAAVVLGDIEAQAAHARQLNERLFTRLAAAFRGATRVIGDRPGLPQILSVRLPGMRGQTVQEMCAARGVAFSTGSACHSEDDDSDNHVLRAIGLDRAAAREVLRFSFCRTTTAADVDAAADACEAVGAELRAIAPEGRSGS